MISKPTIIKIQINFELFFFQTLTTINNKIKPYFYGFSKTLKVSFPRDQLWSRGKETLFQYRKGIAYINRLLTGTETKFLFLEIKVGPEEKKLLRFLKNRKNTVLYDLSTLKFISKELLISYFIISCNTNLLEWHTLYT